jgi:hypothetical protein
MDRSSPNGAKTVKAVSRFTDLTKLVLKPPVVTR